jgi:hypothetical protein
MRLYTVHVRRHGLDPDRDLVLVKEGFSWPAFFFSAFWALWHRLWLAALAILAANAALALAVVLTSPDPVTEIALSVGLAAIVGTVANDFYRRKLDKRGFLLAGVVAADDADAALRRFLDGDPALAREVRP